MCDMYDISYILALKATKKRSHTILTLPEQWLTTPSVDCMQVRLQISASERRR